jgi:hypothetical protein
MSISSLASLRTSATSITPLCAAVEGDEFGLL